MSRVSASAKRDIEDAARRQIEDEKREKLRAERRESDAAFRQREQAEQSAQRALRQRACWCGRDHIRKEALFSSDPQQRPRRNATGTPTARVYVGNLPFRCSDVELTSALHDLLSFHFTCHFVPDGQGGHKGTAFLSFVSPGRAGEAIDRLDGHIVAGREIKAAFAEGKRREPRDHSSRSERQGESGTEVRR